jgi:hypothetical protein
MSGRRSAIRADRDLQAAAAAERDAKSSPTVARPCSRAASRIWLQHAFAGLAQHLRQRQHRGGAATGIAIADHLQDGPSGADRARLRIGFDGLAH